MGEVLALSLQNSRSLERLHWDLHNGPFETAAFWNTMNENANQNRLSSLRLDRNQDGHEEMLRCIPKLLYLRVFEYELSSAHHQVPKHLLLRMVRTNGSLFRFPDSYYDTNDDDSYGLSLWSGKPAVKKRIDAYFQRNKKLPKLLKLLCCPCTEADADVGDDEGGARNTKNENLEEHDNIETLASIHLTPRLFAAAQPAIYTAPNNTLMGLLYLMEEIGPIRIREM